MKISKENFPNDILTEVELEQKKASNPKKSIWVNANAGTGKTKVLVDRILRILLNNTPHYKIICITYTNAAASEINQRILNILSRWSYIDDSVLTQELIKIGIEKVTDTILTKAKSLCNLIIDSNIPLNIYTIHSFCQNLLTNYNIESNINSNFTILENNPSKHLEVCNEVYNKVLLYLLETKNINSNIILNHYNDISLEKFIKDILKYSIELSHLEKTYKNNLQLKKAIFNLFQVSPEMTSYQYKLQNCSNESFDYSGFLTLTTSLNNEHINLTNTDKKYLENIQRWLNLNNKERADNFDIWFKVFFTTINTPREKIFSKKHLSNDFLQQIILKESNRLLRLKENLTNLQLAEGNYELLKISVLANNIYLKTKKNLNLLDYNDLLQSTYDLLKREKVYPWILYNLNQSISHILIDEAQDTSPIQWEIIKSISKEIFSNPHQNKSIFIVGDLKQSIYSFQGAKPENLVKVKEDIKNIIINNQYIWEEVNLNASFRSSKPVLDLVNQVSTNLFASNILQEKEIYHKCIKNNMEGYVEIWPLIAPLSRAIDSNKKCNTISLNSIEINKYPDSKIQSRQKIKPKNINNNKIYQQQAEAIVEKIIYLIKNNIFQPKDIMILTQKRANNLTLLHIIKLLKANNIPTSGLDKVALNNNLVIMDIISICKFILQPLYNLNLANLLKSPIFNFSDEELTYLIKKNTQEFLWEILESSPIPKVIEAKNKLLSWKKYFNENILLTDFFTKILYKDNLYNHYLKYFGEEVKELFNQLLDLVINFEITSNINTLENFIYYFEKTNPILNKEIDNKANEVKLFTIHGSKGLESNVVFLIDNINKLPSNQIISTDIIDLPIIFKLSKINKNYTSTLQKKLFSRAETAIEEEKKRILYVALTRAKKILYISSITKDLEKTNEKSLYSYIINSIKNFTTEEHTFFDNEKFGFMNKIVVVYK